MISYDLISRRYGQLEGVDLLEPLIREVFPGRIALVSSFGIESAVLLHMVSQVERHTPVVFLDTGRLFPETRQYRDEIVAQLKLSDVRSITPLSRDERELDAQGSLWQSNPDLCCHFRKVESLERALHGFQAWITGRKQFHGGMRASLPTLETADWRLKVNPLANWTLEQFKAYAEEHNLARHPLSEKGFTSAGCIPCTSKPSPDGGLRSGRWSGSEKTECGIHFGSDGRVQRPRRSA